MIQAHQARILRVMQLDLPLNLPRDPYAAPPLTEPGLDPLDAYAKGVWVGRRLGYDAASRAFQRRAASTTQTPTEVVQSTVAEDVVDLLRQVPTMTVPQIVGKTCWSRPGVERALARLEGRKVVRRAGFVRLGPGRAAVLWTLVKT